MATAQRVKILGVLALWLGAVTLTAVMSMGLVGVQLPAVRLLDSMGEVVGLIRLLLTIALAAWVMASPPST